MILPIILLTLAPIENRTIPGFLYSPLTDAFVTRTDELERPDSVPLRFVIETTEEDEERSDTPFEQRFGVVSIDRTPVSGIMISLSSGGVAKLLKDGLCSSARGDFLVKMEQCTTAPKQEFVWVPEKHFGDFVKRITTQECESEGEEPAPVKRREIGPPPPEPKVQKVPKPRKMIQSAKKDCGEIQPRTGCLSQLPSCPKGGRLGDDLLNRYGWAYCSSKPTPTVCRGLMPEAVRSGGCEGGDPCGGGGKAPIKTSVKTSANTDDNLLKKIRDLLDSVGEQGGQIEGCGCAQECVKNPKNGICYYEYAPDGQLRPIMRNERCCQKSIDACKSSNGVERMMCELSTSPSYVSKFKDRLFPCN